MLRVASVILDIPTTGLDRAYTYALPDADEAGDFPIRVGCAVEVPFGARRAIGFVTDVQEVPEAFAEPDALLADGKVRSLKKIVRALSTPFFSEIGARCAAWMAERYVAPLSVCIRLFTPPGAVPKMVHTRGFWEVRQAEVGEVDDRWVTPGPAFDTFQPRATAVKQRAVLDVLARGEVRVAELTAEYGSVSSVLKALERQGVVVVEHRRRMRGGAAEKPAAAFAPGPRPELTEAQAAALAAIRARQAAGGGCVLVDGITGSGKTEVYLRAIEDVLEAGRTAVVLVPEIALTPQTVARFRGRFGAVVAVLHSNMGVGERYDQWDFIRSGRARVVVGARSALFAPLADLGLIVIDEEHESTYKQENAPRYVTRDVAEWMARAYGCTLVLGSATPSLEALYRVKRDPSWVRVALPTRANGRPLPPVVVVDRSAEFHSGNTSPVFSAPLQQALATELAQGHKCILFLNQRGFAKSLLCRDCGYIPTCANCAVSLTYHKAARGTGVLVCHHCGHAEPAPAVCPACGSPYLKMFGTGTQQVEEHLRAFLAKLPAPAADAVVVRMDRDTTGGRKGAHQRLLEEFAAPGPAVLLGTQMIAKGLDFEDVTLVGVISADNMLSIPDFRSAERTFNLIEQVAGRAGRATLSGKVIVQTYRPQEPAIRAAARYDRTAFLADELPKRRMLGYPPYVRLANIVYRGEAEVPYEAVLAAATSFATALRSALGAHGEEGPADLSFGQWNLTEPTPCALGRVEGRFRVHTLLKARADFPLSAAVSQALRACKATSDVTISVDIDAYDLL